MEHLAPAEPLDIAAVAREIANLRADFVAWTVWHSHGIFYATGPCTCGCQRTLHAPDADGLRNQLKNASSA